MKEYEEVDKSFGDLIREALVEAQSKTDPLSDVQIIAMFNDDVPPTPPWVGEGAGLGHQGGEGYMPHASEALLEVGDLLPSVTDWTVPTPTPEMGPTKMNEEEWLRELAKRMTAHAERFGATDKQVRREMELAARMLNSYAHLWEMRNREGVVENG